MTRISPQPAISPLVADMETVANFVANGFSDVAPAKPSKLKPVLPLISAVYGGSELGRKIYDSKVEAANNAHRIRFGALFAAVPFTAGGIGTGIAAAITLSVSTGGVAAVIGGSAMVMNAIVGALTVAKRHHVKQIEYMDKNRDDAHRAVSKGMRILHEAGVQYIKSPTLENKQVLVDCKAKFLSMFSVTNGFNPDFNRDGHIGLNDESFGTTPISEAVNALLTQVEHALETDPETIVSITKEISSPLAIGAEIDSSHQSLSDLVNNQLELPAAVVPKVQVIGQGVAR